MRVNSWTAMCLLYTVSQKVPIFNLSSTLSNLTDFQINFRTASQYGILSPLQSNMHDQTRCGDNLQGHLIASDANSLCFYCFLMYASGFIHCTLFLRFLSQLHRR